MKILAEVIERGPLTRREAEVLALLCEGYPDKTISRLLGISIKTLDHHLEHVYQKVGVQHQQMNARCLSIASAVARGWVRLSVQALCMMLALSSVLDQSDPARLSRVRVARAGVYRVRVSD